MSGGNTNVRRVTALPPIRSRMAPKFLFMLPISNMNPTMAVRNDIRYTLKAGNEAVSHKLTQQGL